MRGMSIDFYCGSGSPYAWRVWLALEHKVLPYQLKMMSFDAGDLRTPQYTKLNPRQRVPVIVDRGFVLYESAAIVEYLEDAHPQSGVPLFPTSVQARATVRRLVREADEYLAHPMEGLAAQILFTPKDKWDAGVIAKARDDFVKELAHFEQALASDFLADRVGAADFTVYPLIALALRMERRKPDLGVGAAIGPRLGAWMKRIEALAYFDRTRPPHWK